MRIMKNKALNIYKRRDHPPLLGGTSHSGAYYRRCYKQQQFLVYFSSLHHLLILSKGLTTPAYRSGIVRELRNRSAKPLAKSSATCLILCIPCTFFVNIAWLTALRFRRSEHWLFRSVKTRLLVTIVVTRIEPLRSGAQTPKLRNFNISYFFCLNSELHRSAQPPLLGPDTTFQSSLTKCDSPAAGMRCFRTFSNYMNYYGWSLPLRRSSVGFTQQQRRLYPWILMEPTFPVIHGMLFSRSFFNDPSGIGNNPVLGQQSSSETTNSKDEWTEKTTEQEEAGLAGTAENVARAAIRLIIDFLRKVIEKLVANPGKLAIALVKSVVSSDPTPLLKLFFMSALYATTVGFTGCGVALCQGKDDEVAPCIIDRESYQNLAPAFQNEAINFTKTLRSLHNTHGWFSQEVSLFPDGSRDNLISHNYTLCAEFDRILERAGQIFKTNAACGRIIRGILGGIANDPSILPNERSVLAKAAQESFEQGRWNKAYQELVELRCSAESVNCEMFQTICILCCEEGVGMDTQAQNEETAAKAPPLSEIPILPDDDAEIQEFMDDLIF